MRLTTKRTKKISIPNDPDNGFIIIQALSTNKIALIEEKATKTEINDKGVGVITLSSYTRENEVASSCLKSWGNLFDEKGKAIPFTLQGRMMAEEFDILTEDGTLRFFEWVDNEHTKFLEEIVIEDKEAAKN